MDIKNLSAAVFVILSASLLLAVGVLTLSEASDNYIVSSGTYTENITLLNDTAVDLTKTDVTSVTSCVNATDITTTLPSANYTTTTPDGAVGTVTLIQNDWNNTLTQCTYGYDSYSEGRTASDSTVSALGEFGQWFALIVIALSAGVIIYYLTKGIGGRI